MRELTLYLDNKCNTSCEYCIIDDTRIRNITDDEVINWIVENQDSISFENINLIGGEPTLIYNGRIYEFITDCFHKITMTTNLYDLILIEKWINKSKSKLKFNVSLHEHISNTQIKNIEIFKSYIDKIDIMVTPKNFNWCFDILKKINTLNIPVSLVPIDLNINYTYNGFDKDLLKTKLIDMMDEEYYNNLTNFLFIEKLRFNKNEYNEHKCLNSSPLSIDLNGNITICEYDSPIFNYNLIHRKLYGNIKKDNILTIENNIKIDMDKCSVNPECLNCRKCKNYGCSSKGEILHTNHKFVCDFYKFFHDFIMFEYKFKFNPERLTIFLTEKCNMRCIYCFEGNNTSEGYGNISDENIRNILKFFLSTKGDKKTISLFGGEPSLNKRGLLSILKYTKEFKGDKFITFDINTNLFYLDDELKKIYAEYCNSFYFNFSVSFGGDQKVHDKNRVDVNKNGTYDKIKSNVIELRSYLINNVNNRCCRKPFNIHKNSTITYQDIDNLESIIDQDLLDIKNNIFDSGFLGFIIPNQSPEEIVKDLNYEEIYNKIFNLELKLLEKYSKEELEIIEKFISFYDFFPFNILETNPYLEAYNNPGLYSCGLGSKLFSIRSNGDLLSCHIFLNERNKRYDFINIDYDLIYNGINMNDDRYIILNLERLLQTGVVDFYNYKNEKCEYCIAHKNCHPCFSSIERIEGNRLIKFKDTCTRPISKYKIYSEKMFPVILNRYKQLIKK